jgi:NTE family protein
MKDKKPFKTGLVLSGGAARGFAHIGILKAMHEWGYIPDAVSGVSAGAIVGALYCNGYAPDEIFKFSVKENCLILSG